MSNWPNGPRVALLPLVVGALLMAQPVRAWATSAHLLVLRGAADSAARRPQAFGTVGRSAHGRHRAGHLRGIQESLRSESHTTTRRVALSVGFVGSTYHGYQADATVPTVEQALRDACTALEIAPFKRKIKPQHRWSASSRTDARVHAARMVVAAPLLLPEDFTGDRLVHGLNAELPSDIRIHAACLLPSSLEDFDARLHCSHREYTYRIPLAAIRAISPEEMSPAETLRRAQQVCSEFTGAKHFHNFCSPSRVPTLRSYARANWASLPFSKEKLREAEQLGSTIPVFRFNGTEGELECWPQKMVRGCRADIYRCSARLDSTGGAEGGGEAEGGLEAALTIELAGSGFLYNQIRYMMGALMFVGAGILPVEMVALALSSPAALRLPLAPACGLCLRSQGFHFTTQLGRPLGPLGRGGERGVSCDEALLRQVSGDVSSDDDSSNNDGTDGRVWKSQQVRGAREGGEEGQETKRPSPMFEINHRQAVALHGAEILAGPLRAEGEETEGCGGCGGGEGLVVLEASAAASKADGFYSDKVRPEIDDAWRLVLDGREDVARVRRDVQLWRSSFSGTASADGTSLWARSWLRALAGEPPGRSAGKGEGVSSDDDGEEHTRPRGAEGKEGGEEGAGDVVDVLAALERLAGASAERARVNTERERERRRQFVGEMRAGRRSDAPSSSFYFPPGFRASLLAQTDLLPGGLPSCPCL